jgi:cysteine synthase A
LRTAAPPALPPALRVADGVLDSIGNTPLIEIHSLSRATGCRILAKCEHMNPGGSVKDRPAAMIVRMAEEEGRLVPRAAREAAAASSWLPGWLAGLLGTGGTAAPVGTIVEGTGGNTGIGLAVVAAARGYKAIFTMPAATSVEKQDMMRAFGAEVIVCPPVPFKDPAHYYQRARIIAEQTPGAVWGSQFENTANMRAHVEGTGPEIWRQCAGKVDGLVVAAGTGGTIGGLSTFLKGKKPDVQVYLIDPPGSCLFNYVTKGEMTATAGSSISEGIGIARLTANFAAAKVDGAFVGDDQEIVDMAYYLLR